MACALGSSGRGLFGRSASYDNPYSCSSETYYPYQARSYGGGYAGQQRYPYSHMPGSRQSFFGGLGVSPFSSCGPSNPYTRPQGYTDSGMNWGVGMGMDAGIRSDMGHGSRSFGLSQPPFAGLQSPRGMFAGSMPGREHRSRFSHQGSRRGLAGTRRRYSLSQLFDEDDDSDDEEYSPFMQYGSQRQRQAPFGHSQRPVYGMRSMPRCHRGYDGYDDGDDEDDEFNDFFSFSARRY